MSLASIFVFLLVFALQLLDRYLDLARKRGAHSDELTKLRLEIKQLMKEADQLSTPSTFAQAAKLKRLAVAKEKELAKMQEQDLKGKQSLYDKYAKFLLVTKVIIYAVLVLCFWSTPVTTVPQHLLQPFGKMFSWRGVDTATGPCCGWNTPMAVFDLSGQQAAVPKIRLRACASVARFHGKVRKLLHLIKTASFVLLYSLCRPGNVSEENTVF